MKKEILLWIVLILVVIGVVTVIVVSRRPPEAAVSAPGAQSVTPPSAPSSQTGPDTGTIAAERVPTPVRPEDGPPIDGDPDLVGLTPGQALEVAVMKGVAAAPRGDRTVEDAARRMLESVEPAERLEGAAILAELDLLEPGDLEVFANEGDLYVPLSLLGWLNDGGLLNLRDELIVLLGEAGQGPDELSAALRSQDIGPAARRALIEHLSAELDPEATGQLLRSVAMRSGPEYEARILAATHLAGTMEPATYLTALRSLQERGAETVSDRPPKDGEADQDPRRASPPSDPAWDRGLARLIERNNVPPGLYPGTPPVAVFNIQEELASPHPTALTDLATYLGYALTRPDLTVQTGTTDELEDRLARYEADLPRLSIAEQSSLRRLRGYLQRLHAVEVATGSQVVVDAPPF